MEGILFFVSIWCGIFGQMIRYVFRREHLLSRPWATMILNALFWATGAGMIGMLVASYFDLGETGKMTTYSLVFGGVGILAGLISGYFKSLNAEKRDALLRDNLEWADTGFSAILLASFVMFFIVQAFKIPSGSMRMTFVEGDHLFVNKFIYGIPVPFTDKKIHPFRKIQPGDVVIFRFPTDDKTSKYYGKDFIKRTVALGGQTVEIKNKDVFVDGIKQDCPDVHYEDSFVIPYGHYLSTAAFQAEWEKGAYPGNDIRDNFGPVVVPPNHIFVMGDNRDRSFDARFWGPLPIKDIKGKAWLLYWPLSRIKIVH